MAQKHADRGRALHGWVLRIRAQCASAQDAGRNNSLAASVGMGAALPERLCLLAYSTSEVQPLPLPALRVASRVRSSVARGAM